MLVTNLYFFFFNGCQESMEWGLSLRFATHEGAVGLQIFMLFCHETHWKMLRNLGRNSIALPKMQLSCKNQKIQLSCKNLVLKNPKIQPSLQLCFQPRFR